MKDYENVIDQLEESILLFNKSFKNERTTNNLLNTLETTKNNINTIGPLRIKRGFINLGGNALNFIFGTMDDSDRKDIEEHLKIIEENNHNVINNVNKQINVNNEISKNIRTLGEKIQENQNILSNLMNNSSKLQNKNMEAIEVLQIQFDISNNSEIEKIQDLIAFSRIGILGRNILTNREIQKFNIGNKKLKYIKNAVMEINRNLIIVLMIPTFTEETYHKIEIIPIPTQEKKEIYLTRFDYIMNNETVYDFNQEMNCKNSLRKSNICIQNLIKHKYDNCSQIENKNIEIRELEKGMLITKNIKKTKLIQNCNNINYEIQGNNYIEFKNCTVEINNSIYDNIENIERNVLVLPFYEIMNVSMEIHSLEKINLAHIENIEQIEELKYTHSMTTGISFQV